MNLPDPLLAVGVIAALALLPFMVLLVTSYTKIVVVLGLLRQALGVPQVPPNMVINAIAIILSVYVMVPIGNRAVDAMRGRMDASHAGQRLEDILVIYDAVATPLRGFLHQHSAERDRKFFMRSVAKLWPSEQVADMKEDDLLVLVPSFTVGELTAAFRIGFVLYIVFVVVDLVVANVMLAMGMMMVSPTTVSTPFKLLLFVALDGWERLLQGLVLSYQ
jgi:type III secretion protein R